MIMNRSWDAKHFIDMIVTKDTKCPDSHPDEVVYETWLDSKGFCYYLREENMGDIEYQIRCDEQ